MFLITLRFYENMLCFYYILYIRYCSRVCVCVYTQFNEGVLLKYININ